MSQAAPRPAIDRVIDLEHHAVRTTFFREAKGTIVTFEPLQALVKDKAKIEGTGASFYNGLGFNTVSIVPRTHTWYRTPDLMHFLAQLIESGMLAAYPITATFGFSMGAYGAMTYAELLGAHRVFAVGPISSLDARLVPFEKRFVQDAAHLDWDGPCVDAAVGVAKTPRLTMVYDPLNQADRRHAARILAARQAHGLDAAALRMPGLGHKVMLPLVMLDLLKALSRDAFLGDVDPAAFHRAARARRNLEQYYRVMAKLPRAARSPAFQAALARGEDDARCAGRLIPTMGAEDLKAANGAAQLPWAVMATAGSAAASAARPRPFTAR